MIPSIVLRADNAFAVPLLDEYAAACRRYAEAFPDSQLLARADELDRLAQAFREWGDAHPEKVKMERTVRLADPEPGTRNARRRLRELAEADRRDRELSRIAQTTAQVRIRELEDELSRANAKIYQLQPTTHATMVPTPR